MRFMVLNQIKGKISLISVVAAMLISPSGAMAEEAAASEGEQETSKRGDDIIVTARSLSSPDMPTATPVQILSGDELAHRRQGGLGETLAGLPGVHLDNFGGGASRPVIRGQTVPRIEILTDGANLFDVSSVSPDHAITTDPLLLDGIEILRGPGAARYGGNAMNGAINLIDSKVPKALPEDGLTGAAEVRFGTGDEEKTIVGRVTAGIGPIAIHAEGSRRRSDNYDIPKSFGGSALRDSFADSSSYSFGASWVSSNGYLGAAYARQDSEYGLPGHSHINGVCHTHGIDLHCEAHGEYEDPFGSSDDHTAYIKLRSERIDVRGDYDDLLPWLSHARLRLSYTDYHHDEIDGPALFSQYSNKVYDARVELTHVPFLGFTGTLGGQYTHGTFNGINKNDIHQGLPTSTAGFLQIPPDYITENIAVFLSEKRSFGKIDMEIAARKDWRDIDIPFTPWVVTSASLQRAIDSYDARNGEGAYRRRAEQNYRTANPLSKHDPFSASLALTWRIDNDYSVSLSLARTQRAPSVRELYAYGNNLATNSYEVGLSQTRRASSQFPPSATDVMETAKAVNLTFRKTGGHLEFEVGLFYQDIEDYIFARHIETEIETGIPHHYLIYTAADAKFSGMDGQASYRFTPESRVTVFGDYVRASRIKSLDDNVPRMSPGRLGTRYEGSWGPLSADLEYYRTFGQNRIASYETPTKGYHMVNATLAYRFDVGLGKSVEFYARGINLTNELAFSHTSFVKDQSPLRGRNILFGMRHSF